jgi:hypothetical protein
VVESRVALNSALFRQSGCRPQAAGDLSAKALFNLR